MIIVNVVTIICLIILFLELLAVIINVVLKERAERIAFLRSFKKGKCAIIYVTALPLYCMGHIYSGQAFLPAFFSAVSKIIGLVVLKYDISSVQDLMQVNSLYNFAIYFCFVLVGVNALIFTISLTNQHIWCAFQAFKATMTRKDKLFLFGNNPENISIYLSDKERNKVIIDNISDQDSAKFYMKRISFISTHAYDDLIVKMFRLMQKFDREYIIVINTGCDEKNISLCQMFIKNIESTPKDIKNRLFLNTKIFVFGDPRYETIYEDIMSDAFGCIHYVNKYQKVAMDFIDKYPLSKFMDEEQIDYETSLIRDGVDINVLLIGFGKTAQQLFLTSVANNQFLTSGSVDPELKKVKYHIFDKDAAENNKNLNHSYYRYKYECAELNPEEYLPFPALPAEEKYHHLDINNCDFYNQIRGVVARSSKDSNFVIIAFGSDLENIDMAQKLVKKRKEWGLHNFVIFVKVRAWRKEQTLLKNEDCYFIGNEKDVVYNIDKIISDRIFHMAQMRNEVYDLEDTITRKPDVEINEEYVKKNHDNAYWKWYMKKSQMERESSLYCCLSLRSKLNLMGLDYCEDNGTGDAGLSREEYLDVYAKGDMPDTSKYKVTVNGKPIVSYTLHFPASKRRNLAIHEHQRWNSFMISKGMVPSDRIQIATEKTLDENGEEKFTNGRNYAVRRHGNLTTFDGLIEFRKIVAARDNCSEAETDVIKYDYQLLDDAHWLLQANGYKIIKNVKLK